MKKALVGLIFQRAAPSHLSKLIHTRGEKWKPQRFPFRSLSYTPTIPLHPRVYAHSSRGRRDRHKTARIKARVHTGALASREEEKKNPLPPAHDEERNLRVRHITASLARNFRDSGFHLISYKKKKKRASCAWEILNRAWCETSEQGRTHT